MECSMGNTQSQENIDPTDNMAQTRHHYLAPDLSRMILARQRATAKLFTERKQGSGSPDASPPPPSTEDAARTASPTPQPRNGARRTVKDAGALRFSKLRAIYEKKKAEGRLSDVEEIEFTREANFEKARLRKLRMDEDFDNAPAQEEDDPLFVPAEIPGFSEMHSDQGPTRGKKRSRQQARSDDLLDDSEVQSPKKRKGGKGTGKGKKTSKIAGVDGDTPTVKSKKPKGRKNELPILANIGSLSGANVFEDHERTAGLAQQPTFEAGTVRKKAMTELIASIPRCDLSAARTDQKFLDNAIKAFTGKGSVKPGDNGTWRVLGMKCQLKHYQVMATGFMRKRETENNLPRGGIVADEMGLGKTIEMLANVVNGKPKDGSKLKTTLIVASPALVTQWHQEIMKHCETFKENKQHGLGRVLQYRAKHKITTNDNQDLLETSDIVLTTYAEVCSSYPRGVPPPELTTHEQKDEWWREYFEKYRGLLHRIKWFRIVLDEAQAIKNHLGHTSMACRALDGKFRWLISGTPLLNSKRELYAYFRFLREPHAGSFRLFKENFCSDEEEGSQKLNVFLSRIMIRRTHQDTLFNARLVDLPAPHETTMWLQFNPIERQIYETVRRRFVARINAISKAGTLEKQYKHIFSMLLRLRQICGHALLVQGTISDLLEREDFEKLNNITLGERDLNDEGKALLVHLRETLKAQRGVKSIVGAPGGPTFTESEALSHGVIDVTDCHGETGGKHGLSFRFGNYLKSLVNSEAWTAITERTLCSACRQPPDDPYVTSCFHIYCKICLDDLGHMAGRAGYDCALCTECGEAFATSEPCKQIHDFQDPENDPNRTSSSTKSSGKAKKSDKAGPDWINLPGEVCPSAKTQAIKAQVLNWIEEDADCKIIIFTQFLDMIRILGRVCRSENWDYCEYHGGQSHETRSKSLEEFADQAKQKRILLASLRAGGIGLNLTMASKVLICEPWWNSAMECQAFSRIHRIGQTRSTKLTRLVIKNSIDEAMMSIKERKTNEINEVMQPPKNLSIEELMRLFGPVDQDEDGHPFIYAEEADRDAHLRLANADEEDEDMPMGNEA